MSHLHCCVGICLLVLASSCMPDRAADRPTAALSDYFPPPEEQGGWRTLLPPEGDPDDSQKARIRDVGGVDWDLLKATWDHNAAAPGATGLLVIRHGHVVGEWYKEGNRTTAFNIYSSSKSYTSTAYGLILSDFGNGPLPSGKTLSLDTKVCNTEWLPESLPLPDPRKAEITVRNLLNMASGLAVQNPPEKDHPFEWALGHVARSPMVKLLNDPGAAFHYSNAGVSHLVLVFHRATGEDLYPFLKRRLFEPIGETQLRWKPLGGPEGARGRSARSARDIAASIPTRVSTRGFATWRCTRGNGPASGSYRPRTTTSPGREPRSRPTTAASGGPPRASRARRPTWS